MAFKILLHNTIVIAQDHQLPISTGTQMDLRPYDTAFIMIIAKKAYALQRESPDSAIFWYNKALQLSKEKRFIDGMAYCLQGLGMASIYKGDHTVGEQYLLATLPYSRKAKMYQYLTITTYGNLGSLYNVLGDYQRSAAYYDSSIKESILSQIDPGNAYQLTALNNLSAIYSRLGRFQLALEYTERVETVARKQGYKKILAQSLSNKGELLSKLNQDDKVWSYFKESLEISQQNHLKDDETSTTIAMGEFMLKKGKAKEAITYLKKGTNASIPEAPYYFSIFRGYLLGRAYLELRNYEQATLELEKALADANQYGIKDGLLDAHKTLSEVYEGSGNYRNALSHRLIYDQLKDSLLNREKVKDISNLEIQFRTSEKDRELAVRDKELAEKRLNILRAEELNHKKTTWIWISSLSALLLALLILLLRYRQHNREQRLQQQKEVELLRATMEGEETERIRVGKELHDGVSGFLSAIKMNLVSLRMQRSDVALEPSYTNTLSLADEAADELRKTAHNLVPSNLVKKGLSEAIRGFCNRLSQPNGLHLEVQILGQPTRLNAEKELAVYRVVQELLHNILKHAQASKVLLTISWLESVLMISIEDNGIGMPIRQENEGLGMENISKRIQAANGSLEIDSSENSGTSLYLYFPLEP